MKAAAVPLDIHNAAGASNKALLDNAARPSGALVFGASGAALTETQFDRLKPSSSSTTRGPRRPAARFFSQAGSIGSRCRSRRRRWIS